jgi:rod shape determining protein RodA
MIFDEFSPSRARRTLTAGGRTLRALGLDGPLTGVLAIIVCIGVLVVYSASGQNLKMVEHHLGNIVVAVAAMLALAKLSTPQYLRLFSPAAYIIGILLLIVVDVTGHVGKGAQRWLDIGFVRFQPSEIMKLAVPMICAWYLHERRLPPSFKDLLVMGLLIAIPTVMIARQPDLGTA